MTFNARNVSNVTYPDLPDTIGISLNSRLDCTLVDAYLSTSRLKRLGLNCAKSAFFIIRLVSYDHIGIRL